MSPWGYKEVLGEGVVASACLDACPSWCGCSTWGLSGGLLPRNQWRWPPRLGLSATTVWRRKFSLGEILSLLSAHCPLLGRFFLRWSGSRRRVFQVVPSLSLTLRLTAMFLDAQQWWLTKCLTLLTLRTVQQLLITGRVPLFVCQLRYIGCARPQCWSTVNPHEDSSSEPSIYGIMSCQLRRSLAWFVY